MSKKYYGYIYLIQNIQNNKIYIGRTAQKNPIKYIKKHFQCALRREYPKKYLYNAIRKYGKENFKVKILGEITSRSTRNLNKKLNKAEMECIYFYRSFGSDGEHCDQIYGYNKTIGGDGTTGLIPWNKGLVGIYSDEVLQKMSETRKIKLDSGEIIPWNKGLTKETDERIQLCSENLKNHIVTENTRNKIGAANSGENCGMYGRSVYSIWVEKYGIEEADIRQSEKSRKSSESQLNKKRSPESISKGIATQKRNRELKKLQENKII